MTQRFQVLEMTGQSAANDPQSAAFYLQDLADLCDQTQSAQAVANFQKVAGIPVTGQYDSQMAAAVPVYWPTAPAACASYTASYPSEFDPRLHGQQWPRARHAPATR
jgi:hypothetical protein